MWIGLHLVRNGLISREQLINAIEYCESRRPPIGQIAIQKQRLTVSECFRILSRQAIQPDSFGQIARELRLLTKRQVADLLLAQSEQTPSLSDALIATNALTVEEIERETADARFKRRLQDEDIDTTEHDGVLATAGPAKRTNEKRQHSSHPANDSKTA